MVLNSSDVVAGDDALDTDYNNLRADVVGALITPATTRYYAISPAALKAAIDTDSWLIYTTVAQSSDTTETFFQAVVNLPHGAIVTSLKVYWYRDDAAATGGCALVYTNFQESQTSMASGNSDSTSGYHSVEDTSISNAVIDNANRAYGLAIQITPNDNSDDVKFAGAVITYTIDTSLP